MLSVMLPLTMSRSTDPCTPVTVMSELTVSIFSRRTPAGTPDLGPNVTVFDPSMPTSEIQAAVDAIRHALTTDVPFGNTRLNLQSAIEGETYEYTQMYPGFAKTARDEGFTEIAEWFETLARAEKSHAGRFAQGLEAL